MAGSAAFSPQHEHASASGASPSARYLFQLSFFFFRSSYYLQRECFIERTAGAEEAIVLALERRHSHRCHRLSLYTQSPLMLPLESPPSFFPLPQQCPLPPELLPYLLAAASPSAPLDTY
ncbi:hypothetical protein Q8A67_022857 [Cirrhinus molitorella]|uniref:Uncharacterized protein n=1 Tax=Cirrhinus molitorella TaxID=172907 RepID=A0AA88TM98_9TELE|nr:hypothetical protein Q8A67_022857 [Cirrhinus molitorella]